MASPNTTNSTKGTKVEVAVEAAAAVVLRFVGVGADLVAGFEVQVVKAVKAVKDWMADILQDLPGHPLKHLQMTRTPPPAKLPYQQ